MSNNIMHAAATKWQPEDCRDLYGLEKTQEQRELHSNSEISRDAIDYFHRDRETLGANLAVDWNAYLTGWILGKSRHIWGEN